MRRILPAIVLSAACGGGSGDPADGGAPPDAAPPSRTVTATVTIDSTGVSPEVGFVVPADTRSITIIATGAGDTLYALASLHTGDGLELVGLDPGAPPGPTMQDSYWNEQIGQMPGGLYQSIRLGTFTHVFPYRPGQAVTAGAASLRVAADAAGPVDVTILMPPDDGAAVLHLNLLAVSDSFTFPAEPTFVDEVQAVFAQAGVQVVVDDVVALPGTGLSMITDFTEPQETPASMAAMLPGLAPATISAGALDVFVVDSLPFNVAGLSLGTPGPPRRGSYYYGVVLERQTDDTLFARVLAHEVCHFLALQHVQNTGISGTVYPDPLDDTTPGAGNLMEAGTALTADQTFSLTRSALLATE